MLRDSTPRFVGPSIGPSIGPSVHPSVHHTLLFLGFCSLWPHCFFPNDEVTPNIAPAHPHETGVAVYPALLLLILFFSKIVTKNAAPDQCNQASKQNVVFLSCYMLIRIYRLSNGLSVLLPLNSLMSTKKKIISIVFRSRCPPDKR